MGRIKVRIKGGMSYLEVLGGILIISMVSSVVLMGIQITGEWRRRTQQTKAATWHAENMLVYLQNQLRDASLEDLMKEGDLKPLLKKDTGIDWELEQFGYQLRIWPMTPKGGEPWTQQQLEEKPMIILGTEAKPIQSILPLKINMNKDATYTFERDNYTGHFIGGPQPENSVGILKMEVVRVGDELYYTWEETIARTAQVVQGNDFQSQGITYSIEDVGTGTREGEILHILIDCTSLPENTQGIKGKKLMFRRETKADVLLKIIGTREQVEVLPLEVSPKGEPIIRLEQGKQVGHPTFVMQLIVVDKSGKVLKELVVLEADIGRETK